MSSEFGPGQQPSPSVRPARWDLEFPDLEHLTRRQKSLGWEIFDPAAVERIRSASGRMGMTMDALWNVVSDGKVKWKEFAKLSPALLEAYQKNNDPKTVLTPEQYQAYSELYQLLKSLPAAATHVPARIHGWKIEASPQSGGLNGRWTSNVIRDRDGTAVAGRLIFGNDGQAQQVEGAELLESGIFVQHAKPFHIRTRGGDYRVSFRKGQLVAERLTAGSERTPSDPRLSTALDASGNGRLDDYLAAHGSFDSLNNQPLIERRNSLENGTALYRELYQQFLNEHGPDGQAKLLERVRTLALLGQETEGTALQLRLTDLTKQGRQTSAEFRKVSASLAEAKAFDPQKLQTLEDLAQPLAARFHLIGLRDVSEMTGGRLASFLWNPAQIEKLAGAKDTDSAAARINSIVNLAESAYQAATGAPAPSELREALVSVRVDPYPIADKETGVSLPNGTVGIALFGRTSVDVGRALPLPKILQLKLMLHTNVDLQALKGWKTSADYLYGPSAQINFVQNRDTSVTLTLGFPESRFAFSSQRLSIETGNYLPLEPFFFLEYDAANHYRKDLKRLLHNSGLATLERQTSELLHSATKDGAAPSPETAETLRRTLFNAGAEALPAQTLLAKNTKRTADALGIPDTNHALLARLFFERYRAAARYAVTVLQETQAKKPGSIVGAGIDWDFHNGGVILPQPLIRTQDETFRQYSPLVYDGVVESVRESALPATAAASMALRESTMERRDGKTVLQLTSLQGDPVANHTSYVLSSTPGIDIVPTQSSGRWEIRSSLSEVRMTESVVLTPTGERSVYLSLFAPGRQDEAPTTVWHSDFHSLRGRTAYTTASAPAAVPESSRDQAFRLEASSTLATLAPAPLGTHRVITSATPTSWAWGKLWKKLRYPSGGYSGTTTEF